MTAVTTSYITYSTQHLQQLGRGYLSEHTSGKPMGVKGVRYNNLVGNIAKLSQAQAPAGLSSSIFAVCNPESTNQKSIISNLMLATATITFVYIC